MLSVIMYLLYTVLISDSRLCNSRPLHRAIRMFQSENERQQTERERQTQILSAERERQYQAHSGARQSSDCVTGTWHQQHFTAPEPLLILLVLLIALIIII